MRLQIENSLKELKWNKKKMIDRDLRKRLSMVEDFVLNLQTRSFDVFKFCETSNQGFTYALPNVSEKDQHSEAYQRTLLNLEGIYQFVEYMVVQRNAEANSNKSSAELTQCKRELSTALDQLRIAMGENDVLRKRCRDIIKHTQMVHEKCKLKKLHYKELIRENEHLIAKNRTLDSELKTYETNISNLNTNLDNTKKYTQKTQKDLAYFKDKVHKMTIEINLLEKINIEQSIDDENVKERLQNSEDCIQRLKSHDESLHSHLLSCNNKETCTYSPKKAAQDIEFKYEAAKNLIKRMQTTLKKKTKDLEVKANEITDLKSKLAKTDDKGCGCNKNLIIDVDGIVEENRRLWDGYFHLQLEHLNIEQDLASSRNDYNEVRDKLTEVSSEKHRLLEENIAQKKKLDECLEIIRDLREKCEQLDQTLQDISVRLRKVTSEKERINNELSHFKSYADQEKSMLRDSELKFISLENDYLHAQELLSQYKISFEKIEELLDSKNAEHEEKMSAVTEKLAKEKNEKEQLLEILGSALVSRAVSVYIKMEELEECIESLINFKSDNIAICECENEEVLSAAANKQAVYEELRFKIKNLRNRCSESIDRVTHNANNKLEKYKRTLFCNEDPATIETHMPSTFEAIKLQLSSVCT